MKNSAKTLFTVAIASVLVAAACTAYAGNKDRSGQSAAGQLLINPWAASNGWGSAGLANIQGIESMYSNVAGLSFVQKTQLAYTHSIYFAGTGIGINTLGIGQSLGEERGVLGLTVMLMNFGDIEMTSEDQPDGGFTFCNESGSLVRQIIL